MGGRGRGRARGRAGRGSESEGQDSRRPGEAPQAPRPGPQPGQGWPQPGQQRPPSGQQPPQPSQGWPQPGSSQYPHPSGQQRPPQPRPQPPSAAWGPAAAGQARPGVPAQAPPAGRAYHRSTPSTHEHPGDVDIQQRMQTLDIASGAGDAPGGGRGSRRGGGRVRPDQPANILRTKPSHVASKKGVDGEPVGILTNYFSVETTPQWRLYQYSVQVQPEELRTHVRKALMRVHKKVLGGYLFDGTTMYTVKRLNPDPLELYSDRQEDNERMRLIVKLVCDLVPGDYHYLHVFNVIMRKCFYCLKLQLVGRDFFDPEAKVDIRDFNLQIWPGYKTTINQFENSILMVCEIAHKVLRMDTIHHMLNDYVHNKGPQYRKKFVEDLNGQIVMTDYNKKTYRIDDVKWDQTPESTFTMRGETISYVAYYKKKYQVNIRDMRQPLLLSRSKPRDIRSGMPEVVYLIPELCRATGLTDEMRANFPLMKALAVHTKLGPDQRVQKLMHFNQRMNSTPEVVEELKSWNIKLSKDLVKIQGRVLPMEKMLLGNNATATPAPNSNDGWTREMRSRPMLNIAIVQSWAFITPERNRSESRMFIEIMTKAGQAMGFNLPPPEMTVILRDGGQDYTRAIETVVGRFNPTIVVCVLARKATDRYETIKKLCCIDRAVPTQVIVTKNMTAKSNQSIATKIVVQMNCKLGGAAWAVEIPLAGAMYVGFDVCHDTRSKERSFGAMVATLDRQMTSYYSVVNAHRNGEEISASMSINILKAIKKYEQLNGKIPDRIFIYRDGVGDGQIPYVNDHEVGGIKKALAQHYPSITRIAFILVSKRINSRLFLHGRRIENPIPGTIIDDVVTLPERYDFYLVSQSVREGTVAPTSYNVIYDTSGIPPDRVGGIKKALAQHYPSITRIAFILVSKRINSRLFLHGRRIENPIPGTIIDDVVTLPERYDFYLVSQSVREGTVAPTSYNVIYDTSGIPPDRIQRLSYKLCHMYFNNSTQVRVPSVCQYAHKLAFLAGQSLHGLPSEALENTLYFL